MPNLKYKRFCNDLVKSLGPQGDPDMANAGPVELISCMAVHFKFIVLGMDTGKIIILDVDGNKLPGRDIDAHTSPIMNLSVDDEGEFIASCSFDGKVIISGLLSAQYNIVLNYDRPIMAVAFAPHFSKLKSPMYVTGSEELTLIEERKWPMKRRLTTLHGGEGRISTIKWQHHFIAWANDACVQIYDTSTKKIICRVTRDKEYPSTKIAPCHLFWKSDSVLLIGWANKVKIAMVKEVKTDLVKSLNPLEKGMSASERLQATKREVFITHNIELDLGLCSGIAPYTIDGNGSYIVVLQYMLQREEDLKQGVPKEKVPPQLVVLKPEGYQDQPSEITRDQLPLRGYMIYNCNDYILRFDEEGQRLYVVAPMDMILVQKRTVDDRVQWFLERDRFEEALKVAEKFSSELKVQSVENVGKMYVDYLLEENEFGEAARICTRAYNRPDLKMDLRKRLWEDAAYSFINKDAVYELLGYLPTDKPQLGPEMYEYIIFQLLNSSPEVVCSVLQMWPPHIYSMEAIVKVMETKLKYSPKDEILLRIMAELYATAKQFDKAIGAYLKIKHPDVFSLILKHKLRDPMLNYLKELLELDTQAAVQTLVEMRSLIEPDVVVQRLETWDERFLHHYLDTLFIADSKAAPQYHSRQVKLYAKYDKNKLLSFLQVCTNIPLKEAERICEKEGLIDCKIYLLKRMGNYLEAVKIILSIAKNRGVAAAEKGMKEAVLIMLEQGEQDLFEEVIQTAKTDPIFVRTLLSAAGTAINPLKVIKEVPSKMEIPQLKETMVKVLRDHQLQHSLRGSCRKIVKEDSHEKMGKFVHYFRTGARIDAEAVCELCTAEVFTPLSQKNVIVFKCQHVYHKECISSEQSIIGEVADFHCTVCLVFTKRRVKKK